MLPRSAYSSPAIPSPPRSLSSSPLPPVSPEPEIQSLIIIPPDLPHKPSHTLSERGQRISMAPHSPLLRNTSTLRPQSSVTLTYTPDDDLPDHYESPTILESTLSRNVSQNSLTATETSIPVIVEESTPRTPSKDGSSIPSSPSSNSLLVSPSVVQRRQFSLKRKKVPSYENADKDLPLPAKEEEEVELKVEAVVLIQEKELPLVIDDLAELKVDNIVLDEKEEEEKEELMRKNREKLAWEVIDRARQDAQDERTRREEEEELVAGSKEIYVDASESLSSVHSETQSGEISLVPQTEIDATAEREWLEEQERDREACEVLDLLFEQQTLARRLKEIEELQLKEEKRRKDLLNMRRKFEALRKSGEVMLSGWISVKKGDTVMYRRRRYELQADKLSLYRSEFVSCCPRKSPLMIILNSPSFLQELTNPTDSILTRQIKSVEHHFNPEDSAIRHSFKLVTSEQDWSLFMDEKVGFRFINPE